MAVCVVKKTSELEEGYILTPERYNPSRRLSINKNESYVFLKDLIELSKETLTKRALKKESKEIYLINTADANEGYINGRKNFENTINSSKKIIKKGDVIISRLRPYLRQVAYVDNNLPKIEGENIVYAASTEFFVLEPKREESIAFLVPFLLSEKVQAVFASSVEGSQHPRFKEEDLLNLIIPNSIMEKRDLISQKVEESIKHIRSYEAGMSESIEEINKQLI